MSECINKLQAVVKRFKADEIDADTFGGEVCEVLAEHIQDEFIEADVNVILKLLDQMREHGAGDGETCDEIAAFFKNKVGKLRKDRFDAGKLLEDLTSQGAVPSVEDASSPPLRQEPVRESMAPPPEMSEPESFPETVAPAGDSAPAEVPSLADIAIPAAEPAPAGQSSPAKVSPPETKPSPGKRPRPVRELPMESGSWAAVRLTMLAMGQAFLMFLGLVVMYVPGLRERGTLLFLAAFILGSGLIIYLCWSQMVPNASRIKALGYMFGLCVPVAQMLWFPVAFGGLGRAIRSRHRKLGFGADEEADWASPFCLVVVAVLAILVAVRLLLDNGQDMLAWATPLAIDTGAKPQELAIRLFGIGYVPLLGLLNLAMIGSFVRSMRPVLHKQGKVPRPAWWMIIPALVLMGFVHKIGVAYLRETQAWFLLFW